ncbi:unnamed protein product [Larinioides sclopetarius]|uniref:Uncharacterized protein n=1 Tax=Larinioides sclopetarius TaxID=280406 RepID=A0AAV1ZS14_9ARAC
MCVFCHFMLFSAFAVVFIFNYVDAENLRQRIFKGNDGLCNFDQYKCLNNKCVHRNDLCNGRNDCGDNSDEEHCSTYMNGCPSHRSFSCSRNSNYYDRCIPLSWKCDGRKDCSNGKDEEQCTEDYEDLSPALLHKARFRALNWTYQLRNEDHSTHKWGPDVGRIAVALYLSNDSYFLGNRSIRDEISYELSLDLLSRLALKKIEDISSTELAYFINAFLVTCIDPRKFQVLDLVSELRKRVDAQNYTNPSVMLALCNAGDRITERDVEKLISVFWSAHREFWTDTQALAVLALTCAAKQPYEVFDMDEINELTMELKKRQYRNGTVENLKTTALVLQALFASESEADEDNFDEEKALKQILRSQKTDGSFGNIPNTYYVLPVLRCRSLVNISSSHCKAPVIDEKQALKDLMNQVGEKWSVRFSLWIGNNRTVERTLTLSVPANSSFYRIMEFAAGVDNRFDFEYSMRNGKPYIYSISEIQDDPENGMFWFLFKSSSSDASDMELITKSPADVVPNNKQHFIFWYKCGSWNR